MWDQSPRRDQRHDPHLSEGKVDHFARPDARPSPPSFDDFLGMRAVPVDPSYRTITPDTRALYLPWTHVPENVPRVAEHIRELFDKRPECRDAVVLSELVASKESKDRLETLLNRIIHEEPRRAQHTLTALEWNLGTKLERTLAKELRSIVWGEDDKVRTRSQDGLCGFLSRTVQLGWDRVFHPELFRTPSGVTPPRRIDLKFIDIDSPAEIGPVLAAGYQHSLLSKNLDKSLVRSVSDTRAQLDITPLSSSAERQAAAGTFLDDLFSNYVCAGVAQSMLLSSYRNDTMAQQIRTWRSHLPSTTPIVALMGAAHAEVPYRGVTQGGAAVSYVVLSSSVLDHAPEGLPAQSPLSLTDRLMIKIARDEAVPAAEVREGFVQHLLAKRIWMESRFGETLASSGEGEAHSKGYETARYLSSVLVMMSDEDELNDLLATWALEVAGATGRTEEERSYKLVLELFMNVADEWMERKLELTRDKRGKLRMNEVLDAIYDRYVRVR
jgi:hypothetical protein